MVLQWAGAGVMAAMLPGTQGTGRIAWGAATASSRLSWQEPGTFLRCYCRRAFYTHEQAHAAEVGALLGTCSRAW